VVKLVPGVDVTLIFLIGPKPFGPVVAPMKTMLPSGMNSHGFASGSGAIELTPNGIVAATAISRRIFGEFSQGIERPENSATRSPSR